MKRILAVTFIIAMLAGTSLWALRGPVKGRTHNRDLQKRSGHAEWAKCEGKDKDGVVHSQAYIIVDVDKPWENLPKKPHKPQRWGVDYSASGSTWGMAIDGSYTIYASVPNDTDGEYTGTADGNFSVTAYAQNFDWWEDVDAEEALSSCSGSSSSDTKNSLGLVLHRTRSEAYKFAQKGES